MQQEKNLIAGEIVPVLLVTNYKEQDLKICEENGIRIFEYSPVDILTKFSNEIIINVSYVDEGEKTGLKYVQTILSQRIREVTILLRTDKLCAWNITL